MWSPRPLHDFIKGIKVPGIFFFYNLAGFVEMLDVMRVIVVRIERLDKIVALPWHKHFVSAEHRLQLIIGQNMIEYVAPDAGFLRSAPAEIPAVVHESDIIRVDVLPSPVQSRQLAEMRISTRDVIADVVLEIAEIEFTAGLILRNGRAHLERQINRVTRHTVNLMRRDDDLRGELILMSVLLRLHSSVLAGLS